MSRKESLDFFSLMIILLFIIEHYWKLTFIENNKIKYKKYNNLYKKPSAVLCSTIFLIKPIFLNPNILPLLNDYRISHIP